MIAKKLNFFDNIKEYQEIIQNHSFHFLPSFRRFVSFAGQNDKVGYGNGWNDSIHSLMVHYHSVTFQNGNDHYGMLRCHYGMLHIIPEW